ncbi:MAG TPA: 5-formyltetrahydrofolate cyclo-ligase [Verrucomicrobiota bacterium]|nr:5-formyltetrahydrofolate cyclo-ligase [Verrucomicrobiota bacterium]
MSRTKQRTDSLKAKRLTRRKARLAIASLSLDQATRDSEAVCRLILESPDWQVAAQVMLYMPLAGELDVKPLVSNGLKTGKRVALPKYSAENNCYEACVITNLGDVVLGNFNVLEPPVDSLKMDTKQLDLAIVPGVAFDGRGGRLGRGEGFFDRLLIDISAKKCGVCFEQQLCHNVPVERHDVKMDMIATPSGWLNPPPA